MSVSSILFFASCYSMYWLGGYNAKHPGAAWRTVREVGAWIWKVVNP